MSQRKLRTYDKKFKLNALKLYQSSGRSYKQVADELGIPPATLVGWVHAYEESGVEAFPGKGHMKPSDAEVAQLRRELAIVREERDILKNVITFKRMIKKF